MSTEQLKEILEKHKKWLNNEDDGIRADLRDADLSGANLSGANLRGAIGNNKEVKSLQLGKYDITILVDVRIHIGCQNHTILGWENFTDEEISEMDSGALEWWKQWKEVILKVAKGE